MRYWLIKSEPGKYGWDDLVREGSTLWDGVRNHRAANNLRAMQQGEQAFFYHSVKGKEIVGIAEVARAGLTDAGDPEGRWPTVEFRPLEALAHPVTLAEIKAEAALAGIELVSQSRLSVAEITPEEWKTIRAMSEA